jgi:hypothetical protein
MALAIGLLLYQPNLMKLGPRSLGVVKWGLFLEIIAILSEAANTFWSVAFFSSSFPCCGQVYGFGIRNWQFGWRLMK